MTIKNSATRLLVVVILLMFGALFKPGINMPDSIYNYVFVIDITQSMNAQDYHLENMPADRLSFVKQSLQHVLEKLPCQSKVSIGLFTTKNMFLLFEPLEICAHFNVIESSLQKVDWRMAWATDSHITRGLYTSIRDISKIQSKPRLVFFSDGHQTPEIKKAPPFLLTPGAVQGYIIGVGNLSPVSIPKYDKNNVQTGFWLKQDAEYRAQQKSKPDSSTQKFLSSVKETELQHLAGITGLQYHHLETPDKLNKVLQTASMGQTVNIKQDLSWLLVCLALLLFIMPYMKLPPKNG